MILQHADRIEPEQGYAVQNSRHNVAEEMDFIKPMAANRGENSLPDHGQGHLEFFGVSQGMRLIGWHDNHFTFFLG